MVIWPTPGLIAHSHPIRTQGRRGLARLRSPPTPAAQNKELSTTRRPDKHRGTQAAYARGDMVRGCSALVRSTRYVGCWGGFTASSCLQSTPYGLRTTEYRVYYSGRSTLYLITYVLAYSPTRTPYGMYVLRTRSPEAGTGGRPKPARRSLTWQTRLCIGLPSIV